MPLAGIKHLCVLAAFLEKALIISV